MGIWPPYADGTDINAVDAVPHKCLIATGNVLSCFVYYMMLELHFDFDHRKRTL